MTILLKNVVTSLQIHFKRQSCVSKCCLDWGTLALRVSCTAKQWKKVYFEAIELQSNLSPAARQNLTDMINLLMFTDLKIHSTEPATTKKQASIGNNPNKNPTVFMHFKILTRRGGGRKYYETPGGWHELPFPGLLTNTFFPLSKHLKNNLSVPRLGHFPRIKEKAAADRVC